jgi:tellurite methyltransferase
MHISGWEKRYQSRERPAEDFNLTPAGLLVETAEKLDPANALDLACGTGRNALWLAERGWKVTAVDGSRAAIRALLDRASERRLNIDAQVIDLESHAFEIRPAAWNLIVICYYLQRDLFEMAKSGIVDGGILVAIAHLATPGEQVSAHRLRPGELQGYFQDWEILHHYEGGSRDVTHKRPAAEIAVRKRGDGKG